jgi:hypothetical protein
MDAQQAVMLRLIEACRQRCVAFACPTHTVYVGQPVAGREAA